MTLPVALAACVLVGWGSPAHGQLTLISQFSPGLGTLVGTGFEPTSDRVWVYADFGATINSYSRSGTAGATVTRPGESANDFDLSFAPVSFTLGTTSVPAGSMLVINGETGTADIHAVNPTTGSVVASLATAFGVSHVVGGAYHPTRGTFFLVQDRVPGGTEANLIAEVNPITGAVLNTFGTGSSTYTINFGDLEVHSGTGNLYLVSSDETTIRELTPTGAFVQELALPAGVNSLTGLGFDELRGEAWVSGNGNVYRLGGFTPVPEPATVFGVAAAVLATGAWVRRRFVYCSLRERSW
jgi:hypothetical protein